MISVVMSHPANFILSPDAEECTKAHRARSKKK